MSSMRTHILALSFPVHLRPFGQKSELTLQPLGPLRQSLDATVRHRYVHLKVRSAATLSASTYASAKPPNPATPAPRDALSFDTAGEGRLLQDIVDEALAQGVWITRTRRLRGQEFVEVHPSIRLATTTAWQQRKDDQDCSGAVKTIKNHGGNDDEDNQDDHGGSDDDVKTITAAAMTAKLIKSAIATRRQSRATAAAATMRSQSRWQRRREDDHGGGDDGDDQDGGGVGDSVGEVQFGLVWAILGQTRNRTI
ncbi:hypothetical protein EDB84DRAFT_1570302 [Lactarius hengduanensis]|nr:hypothetical protein EDB84DRAFT_1570302 [Lactarius hengduanensis]